MTFINYINKFCGEPDDNNSGFVFKLSCDFHRNVFELQGSLSRLDKLDNHSYYDLCNPDSRLYKKVQTLCRLFREVPEEYAVRSYPSLHISIAPLYFSSDVLKFSARFRYNGYLRPLLYSFTFPTDPALLTMWHDVVPQLISNHDQFIPEYESYSTSIMPTYVAPPVTMDGGRVASHANFSPIASIDTTMDMSELDVMLFDLLDVQDDDVIGISAEEVVPEPTTTPNNIGSAIFDVSGVDIYGGISAEEVVSELTTTPNNIGSHEYNTFVGIFDVEEEVDKMEYVQQPELVSSNYDDDDEFLMSCSWWNDIFDMDHEFGEFRTQ